MDKVLHVLPMNKMSGAERMALLICRNLKSYKPIVVCGGEELASAFRENGIEAYTINFSIKNIIGNSKSLKKIIKNNDIKIIHAHDNTASLISYTAKKLFRLDVKLISHIHNCYPFLKEDGLNKKVDRYLRNRYDFNITCGQVVTDFYKENTDYFKEENNLTLSNGMDIDYITSIDENDVKAIIEKYEIPNDKKILGFIGRLDEQKGIIPFINELSKHKEDFKASKILLVGSGSQENEVKKLIKKYDLEDLFILTGFQENIKNFYPIIDVFFLPSLYEGLPMVLLEAMSFRLPIVSMNVGSISEVIKNNKTGYLINSGDYKEFVTKLKEIKSDKKAMNEIGKNAFKYVNENYNINVYSKTLENIYAKVLN